MFMYFVCRIVEWTEIENMDVDLILSKDLYRNGRNAQQTDKDIMTCKDLRTHVIRYACHPLHLWCLPECS